MKRTPKPVARKRTPVAKPAAPLAERVDDAVATLRKLGSRAHRDGMARYAIPSDRAFGVPMSKIQGVAKALGRDHALAEALWDTGWYEARMLACYVDDPAEVTAAQMDRWCRDFDNWAHCDTACFVLFDRTPHAWKKVTAWAKRKDEFEKRAAFALLASLAGHDKTAPDARFVEGLALVEREAHDDRNFVKKGISWALRGIGRRRTLTAAANAVAKRLAASEDPSARWIGKDALRDLAKFTARRAAKAENRDG
jgi:3-methyladenine DNA glycosylase AlkD